MKLPKWLIGEPDPPPVPASVRAAEKERIIQNIVRSYLDRDDVRDGVADWLTNVYMDDVPPVADLYDRIATRRASAALVAETPEEKS